MTKHVLRLPVTERGRYWLRFLVHLAGGWEFPDGTHATEYDWDEEAARIDSEAARLAIGEASA